MADSDLKIAVTTTADVTGIKQVSDEMKVLQSVAARTGESLAQVQARFAQGSTLVKAITQEAEKTAEAFTFTRTEAASLANELLRGEISMRGLGTSLAEFGNIWAVAGIAAFTVFELIDKSAQAALKLAEAAVKENTELERSVAKWAQMAESAKTIGDQVRISDAASAQVQKAQDALLKLKGTEESYADALRETLMLLRIAAQGDPREEQTKKLKQAQDDLNRSILDQNLLLLIAAQNAAKFDAAEQKVWGGEGQAVIAQYTAKVDAAFANMKSWQEKLAADPSNKAIGDAYADALKKLQEAQAELAKLTEDQKQYTSAVEASAKAWDKVTEAITRALDKEAKLIDEQNKKTLDQFIKREDELQKIEDQDRILLDAGNAEAVIQDKVTQRVHQRSIELRQIGIYGDENTRQSLASGEALRHELEVQQGQGKAQSELNVQMKEYETILQNIRQQQQVTGAQAFIGPDQKNLQLLQQYRAEIMQVIAAMQQQQARKGGLTDPAEIARANQELQKFSAQYQLLATKIITTTHQFQAGLQNWADSFGSVGTQLANTLQQTVGAALQSINQWIVTGKFNMQALLQQVAQLGLQLVEQLLIQRVVAMINARLAETQAVASAQIIAAAWASAATAVTIATEGEAAYAAPGAVAIGLAGVQAALGLGKLHEGGRLQDRRMHSGGLAADEVPIIAQEGEIMIQRSVAQAPGMSDFLLGLNQGMFHSGGFVAGGRYHRGGGGEMTNFYDLYRKYGPSIFATGGGPQTGGYVPPLGGIDIPPADLTDPFGGPPESKFQDDFNQRVSMFDTRFWAGFGQTPSMGIPAFGPTAINTNWVNYPGVGLVPMAVPVTTDFSTIAGTRGLPPKQTTHSGGLISRFHSGGAVGGRGGGGVHIYAFTDLKALTKHMGSREGQKIIFDTVKGRRIDLGI